MNKINKLLKISIVAALSQTLIACGGKEYLSMYDRYVPENTQATLDANPVNDNSTASISESTPSSVSGSSTTQVSPLVSLREKILKNSDLDPKALDNAFDYFDKHHAKIKNQNYLTIFNIGKHSGKKRMYLIEMKTGSVTLLNAAHGSGSDPDNDGVATLFSNTPDSQKSSLGFMLTAEHYYGKHGISLKLDGQESRNSNVRARSIVIHGASYVDPSLSKMGRSWGCPAVPDNKIASVVSKLEGGSLFYIFHAKYD